MSEEEENKLNKILYYSDIHPADTDFINNIIFNLCQERNIANSILTELEEWLKENQYYYNATGRRKRKNIIEILDKIQKLKEKYK